MFEGLPTTPLELGVVIITASILFSIVAKLPDLVIGTTRMVARARNGQQTKGAPR